VVCCIATPRGKGANVEKQMATTLKLRLSMLFYGDAPER
jgi:hypothetical protein